jgi:tRNA(fMet)-specific endonuclease VapC
MLDTNIVSFALRSRSQPVMDRLRAHRPADVCISVVTLAELRFGAAKSAARARYDAAIDVFVSRVGVLPFDDAAAGHYGEVRASLARAGQRIGDLDTLIAGHALAAGCTLVTHNVGEFGRVPGLVVEDWTTPP